METLKTILPTLHRGLWATSLDLKDAYLHIPIHPDHQKFLSFRYKRRDYAFRALPFGLATAPRVFSRVTKVVLAFLRRRGLHVHAYLDDWLLLGRSEREASEVTAYVITLLENLGWIINREKSSPVPTQQITYLGAILDFTTGRAFPTQVRLLALEELVSQLQSRRKAPAKLWLRVLGVMASLVDIVPDCRLFMRPIQVHLLRFFKPSVDPLQKVIPLGEEVKAHLDWWTHPQGLLSGPTPFDDVNDRRLSHRLGSSLALPDRGGPVGPRRNSPTHQRLRDGSDLLSALDLAAASTGPQSDRSVRQFDSGLIHQPARGNEVPVPVRENVGPSSLVQRSQHFTQGLLPGGQRQRYGRRSVEGHPQGNGMVSLPDVGRSSLPNVRPSLCRPIRISGQQQAANVLHQSLPPTGVGDGCSGHILGQPVQLHLPTMVPPSTGPSEDQGLQNRRAPGRSVLAESSLVPPALGLTGGSTLQAPPQGQSSHPAGRPSVASTAAPSASGSLEVIIRRLQDQGLPHEAAVIAADSRRPSTRSTYDSRLDRFRQWAANRDVDPLEAPVEVIAEFLVTLFKEGKQVSTIRNYRSAIAAIHSGFADG